MNSTVRPMKPFEMDDIVELWSRLAREMLALGSTVAVDKENVKGFREFLRSLSKEDENQVIISEIDGRIVGFLMFLKKAKSPVRLTHSQATIDSLYVDEEHRRKGIATQLLKRCLEYLRSTDVEDVRVNFLANNIPARGLYKKLGFTDHMIIMNRQLQSTS